MHMDTVNLLLVDDENEFRQTVAKRLMKRGMNVRQASSGQECLDSIDQNPVDVVVLDVKMPGMDGIETLHRIKEKHPETEVIMLTGHASLEVAIEGMELGAFDYLMKPIDIDELLYKLEDANKKRNIQTQKIRAMKEVRGSTGS